MNPKNLILSFFSFTLICLSFSLTIFLTELSAFADNASCISLTGTAESENTNAGKIYFDEDYLPTEAGKILGVLGGMIAPAKSLAACTSKGDIVNETGDGEVDNDEVGDFHIEGYAWNDNLGFFSFYCQDGKNSGQDCGDFDYGVEIGELVDGERALSGYAWNDVFGWVSFKNMSGAEVPYGVTADSNGNLFGYAWSEAGVWINFSGAKLNLDSIPEPVTACNALSPCIEITPSLVGLAGLGARNEMKIADGKDGYDVHLYLKSGVNGEAFFDVYDEAYFRSNFRIHWEDTVKMNQIEGGFLEDSVADLRTPFDKGSGGAVVFKPRSMADFVQDPDDPEHFISKKKVSSYAPTSSANTSLTTSTALPFVVPNEGPENVDFENYERNVLRLKYANVGIKNLVSGEENSNVIIYPNRNIRGVEFYFRPWIELNTLYFSDKKDVIQMERGLPGIFSVGARVNVPGVVEEEVVDDSEELPAEEVPEEVFEIPLMGENEWEFMDLEAEGTDYNVGDKLKVIVDALGQMHFAYIKQGQGIAHSTFDEKNILVEALSGTSANFDLKMDAALPVAVFSGGTNGGLYYAVRNGNGEKPSTEWQSAAVFPPDQLANNQLSLAINNGIYGVAYTGKGNVLGYSFCMKGCEDPTSASWLSETVDDAWKADGWGANLSFYNGIPAITSISADVNKPSTLRFAVRNGKGKGTCTNKDWNCYSVDGAYGNANQIVSMVGGTSDPRIVGKTAIAYLKEEKAGYSLKFALTGEAEAEGCDFDKQFFSCESVSTNVSSLAYPNLKQINGTYVLTWVENGELKLAHRADGKWQIQTVTKGDLAYPNVVMVGDNLYVVYYNKKTAEVVLAKTDLANRSTADASWLNRVFALFSRLDSKSLMANVAGGAEGAEVPKEVVNLSVDLVLNYDKKATNARCDLADMPLILNEEGVPVRIEADSDRFAFSFVNLPKEMEEEARIDNATDASRLSFDTMSFGKFLNRNITPLEAMAALDDPKDEVCSFVEAPYIFSEVSYEIEGKPVKYFSNKLPRIGGSYIGNQTIVVKGQILAQKAFTPAVDVKSAVTSGDVNINIVRDTVYKNIRSLLKEVSAREGGSCTLSDLGERPGVNAECSYDVYSVKDEMVIHFNAPKVVIDSDIVLSPEQKTLLVVENGNLFVNGDLYGDGARGKLAIVVLRGHDQTDGEGGNMYIGPTVKNIQANMILDGTLFSYKGEKIDDIDSSSGEPIWPENIDERAEIFKNQLRIEGSLSSANTIGGAEKTADSAGRDTWFLIWGRGKVHEANSEGGFTVEQIRQAQKYDLNYLRLFKMQLDLDIWGFPIDQKCNQGITPEMQYLLDKRKSGAMSADERAWFDSEYSQFVVCDGIDPTKLYKEDDEGGESGDLVPPSDPSVYAKGSLDAENKPKDFSPVYIEYVPAQSFIFSKSGDVQISN